MKKLLIALLLLTAGIAQGQSKLTGSTSFTGQWSFKVVGADTVYQMGNTLFSPAQYPYMATRWYISQNYAPIGVGGYKLKSDTVNAQGYVRNWYLTNQLAQYVKFTDTSSLFTNLVHKTGTETINGLKTFGNNSTWGSGNFVGTITPGYGLWYDNSSGTANQLAVRASSIQYNYGSSFATAINFTVPTHSNSVSVQDKSGVFALTNDTTIFRSVANSMSLAQLHSTYQTSVQVQTIADLYAYNTTGLSSNAILNVNGYYAANDQGGGTFIWNDTSTATDNGGTVIQPTGVPTGRFLRQFTGPINAKWFGAIPNGSRIVTTNLQAALNQTGHIIVPFDANNYIIDNRLLISSNTWLDVDPNSTIYEASGTNTVMLRNSTIDTVGVTDNHITITGGIWNLNWAGNRGLHTWSAAYSLINSDKTSPVRGVAGVIDLTGVSYAKVSNLTIQDANIFSLHITHADHIEIGNIYFLRTVATISDGIHLSAPITNFSIHDITGKTGDDFVALGAFEWYIASPGRQHGDITLGSIERIKPDTVTWSLIKMYPGTNAAIRNITINDVKGISSNQAFYWGYAPDTVNPSNSTGAGLLDNITISNVSAKTINYTGTGSPFGPFGSVFLINANVSDLVMRNMNLDSTYCPNLANIQPYLSFGNFYTGGGLYTAKRITIDNFHQNMTMPYNAWFTFFDTVYGLNITNSSFIGTGIFTGNYQYQTVNIASSSHVYDVKLVGNSFINSSGAILQQGTTDSLTVEATNNKFVNFSNGFQFSGKAKLNLTGNTFIKNNGFIVTSNVASTISSAANYEDASGTGVTLSRTGGTIRYNGTDLPVDLATLTPQTSDLVNNSNSGSGAVGVNEYTGSAWVPIASSGGTITALTGDVSASGSGSVAATLATVNASPGTYGSATQTPVFVVNGKGLVTSNTNTTITPAVGSITGFGTGIATFLATPSSANLLSALTTKTGTGNSVFSISPTFTGTAAFAAIAASGQVKSTGNNIIAQGNATGATGAGTTIAYDVADDWGLVFSYNYTTATYKRIRIGNQSSVNYLEVDPTTGISTPTSMTAASFVKTGGTSSQLLFADGSSGTALPSGTTATTPSANDNSTKVATTAYADATVRSGQVALTAGVATITITGLTTGSIATTGFVAIGGTIATTWQYQAVCTANTLTITAITNAGATDTTDTSTINYMVKL